MSEQDKTKSDDLKTDDAGAAVPEDEITEAELDTVSGGINPQPLPPHRPTPMPM